MSAATTQQLIARVQQAARKLPGGRQTDALLTYDEVAPQAADDVALNVELGHLCLGMGTPAEAIAHYAIAVEHDPTNAHYLGFLGAAYQQNGQPDRSFEVFNRAMQSNAEMPGVLHGLGIHYMGCSDYARAREHLEKAQRLKPGDAGIRTNLATTLAHLNEHEAALKHAEKALRQDSANPNAHYAVGRVLADLGRIDEAIRHFEKTIRQHRTFGGAYDLLARMKKFTAADQAFIARTEKVLQQGMPPSERRSLHYALGKMYDDCGDWDKAFEHYGAANLLHKQDFDVKREKKRFKKTKQVYNASSLKTFREFGHPSQHPVFIVGMPRSGTTLMERLIASHPLAAGAGELAEIPRIAAQLSNPDDLPRYVANMRANLTSERITEHAESYLNVLRQGHGNADRVVDKLPGNFLHLGLISTMFPDAKIIHAIRHPLDTCLSCFFQNFTSVPWANDFEMIAAVYAFYRDVMSYWHTVLPEGSIIDVEYEQLIEDPEIQGRRLLEFCGLSWDDSLLDFHKEAGVVKTASFWQARQAIYKDSKMRWKNYAAHLGELAGGLSAHLAEDRAELANQGIILGTPSGFARLRKLLG